MKISIKQKGNFKRTERYFKNVENGVRLDGLKRYAVQGVKALASGTPKDTGTTAASWYYKIEREKGRITLSFCNSNIKDGVPIAIVLQYGHATKNGGWIEGRDYINPALRPFFDKLAEDAWKEVTTV